MQVPLFRLQCGVNSYDWGKKGSESAAAKFAAATAPADFSVQDDKPYAELWMGTHPSNPSKDVDTGRSLLELVEENQAFLSPAVTAKFGRKLPFLFKPEMAIAITPFEGLCGFRPLDEIAHFLDAVPALRELVGEDKAAQFTAAAKDGSADEGAKKKALREAFNALMSASESALAAATEKLVADAAGEGAEFAGKGVASTSGKTLSELVGRLHGQFGADYGLFVLFFCNFVTLEPGEALFLQADDIHAYVSGDIMECMAASDNVVRAGFTPKFKDVPTLVDMLTYGYAPIDEQKMQPRDYPFATLNRAAYSSGSHALLYDPPIEEFSVVGGSLKAEGAKASFDPIDGPSIVICTKGSGKISVGPTVKELKEGWVYFVGATAECVIEAEGLAEGEELVFFKAFCEVEDHSNGNGGAAL
ncbi:hypothetical protein RB597_009351 [Gaeumannomyces tritici]